MILGERLRPDLALFLAGPVSHQDRALRVRVHAREDAHGLEHGDRAGAVVGRAARAVPRIEVRRHHHVLIGLLGPTDGCDGVEHRLLAEELRVEVHPERRLRAALGEPEHEAVVLAAQREYGGHDVIGLEYLARAPRVLRARRQHAGDPCLLQPHAEFPAAKCQAVAGAAHVAAAPFAGDLRAKRIHPLARARRRIRRPVFARAAGGLRCGHQHELAARLWQPPDELRTVREAGQDDRSRRHVPATGARAVAHHRRLEGAHPRRYEVHVRPSAPPPAPGPILLDARRDAPRLVGAQQPLLRAARVGCALKAGTERVEEDGGQFHGMGAVHADRPDPAQHGVVTRGGRRRLCAEGRQRCEHEAGGSDGVREWAHSARWRSARTGEPGRQSAGGGAVREVTDATRQALRHELAGLEGVVGFLHT